MSRIIIDLDVEASLTVEPDGEFHVSWRDGNCPERHEAYADLTTALLRIAVLNHMVANNMYDVHHLPEHFTRHAQSYLRKVARPRNEPVHFWVQIWVPTRRVIRKFSRIRRKSEA